MFNKSIAYRLTFFISLAVIIVFVAFIIANYLFNRKILHDNIENHAISMSMEVNSLVNQNTVITREVSKNIAEQVIYYSQNEDTEILLSMVMKKYPFLNAIHVKVDSSVSLPFNYYYIFRSVDEEFVFQKNTAPIFYCQIEKQLFENISDSTASGWTEPYRCHEKGNVVVSYYTPVVYYDKDGRKSYSGHVICEILLTELNNAINQMDIGERGYAFLITNEGDYITHPNEDWILNQNVYALSTKSVNRKKLNLDEILQNRQTGSAVVYPEILNFEKSWVYYTPVNENRWFLLFIMPYRELFGQLYQVTTRMFIFALAGIFLIFFIIKYITKTLVEPLSNVTSKLTALSGTDEKNGNTLNEVKQVSDTLELLKEWFDQYRIASEQEELNSLRRKQDLQQASEIQQSLIKTNFPAFPNRNDIDLYAIYQPARVVSGDLFDYFFIDDENLVFTIGDVSGKGIPAAVFMSVAQTIIRNKTTSLKKAKEIVSDVNIELSTSNKHQYFLTLFLGVLNLKSGVLNYCNAAHDFPYILKPNGNITGLNEAHGLPLGLYPEKEYKDTRIKLAKGDCLVLYTDGVTELLNDRKIQYGTERFKENLAKLANLAPSDMVKKLYENLEQFRGDSPQTDDICLFAIKYMP
jgi:sigma-B regulation protein RsbU (phosphoserine phosphatase)